MARDSERWASRFRNARLLAIAARAWNFHVALKARLRSSSEQLLLSRWPSTRTHALLCWSSSTRLGNRRHLKSSRARAQEMAARAGAVSFGCVLHLWLDHVTDGLRIECAGRELRAVTKRRPFRHWFDFACQRQTWRDREGVASDFGARLARSRCLRAWHCRYQQLWWAQWLVQSSCDWKVDVVARRCLVAWRTLQADGRRR